MQLLRQGPCTLSQLSDAVGVPSHELLVSLTRLEMEKLVSCSCGMYALR